MGREIAKLRRFLSAPPEVSEEAMRATFFINLNINFLDSIKNELDKASKSDKIRLGLIVIWAPNNYGKP